MKNNQGQPLCLNLIRSKWSKSAYLLYKNVGDCKRAIRITMRLWFNNYKPEVRRIVRRKEFSSINIDRDQVPIFYSELIVSLVLQNIQQIQQNMVPWQFFYRILGRIIPRCLHKCTVNAQKSITAEHNKKENIIYFQFLRSAAISVVFPFFFSKGELVSMTSFHQPSMTPLNNLKINQLIKIIDRKENK